MIIGYLFNGKEEIYDGNCDIKIKGFDTVGQLKKLISDQLNSVDDEIVMINLAYDNLKKIKLIGNCTTYLGKNNVLTMIYTIFNNNFINYLNSNGRIYIENDIIYEEYTCNYIYDKLEYTYTLTRKKKYLCIYCYYEKIGYGKNQTNLKHFINHGMKVEDMDYIFIINGNICNVELPQNARIMYNYNCTDFEGWYRALMKYDWYDYQYLFFINCSVLGPLNFDLSDEIIENWIEPFINKLDNETVLCSNVITNVFNGPKCTSYNFLLDTRIIPYLLNDEITVNGITNTVFGIKENRFDAIMTGEYGLSVLILKLGYKITCLHPGISDRGELRMTLFMKNNWIDGKMRACPPCSYYECMRIIKKPIRNPPTDYNLLKCDEKGICYTNSNYNWNSKKEYYQKFGFSEEILF